MRRLLSVSDGRKPTAEVLQFPTSVPAQPSEPKSDEPSPESPIAQSGPSAHAKMRRDSRMTSGMGRLRRAWPDLRDFGNSGPLSCLIRGRCGCFSQMVRQETEALAPAPAIGYERGAGASQRRPLSLSKYTGSGPSSSSARTVTPGRALAQALGVLP